MAKLQLKKPLKIDGEEVKEIEYDLDSLTGTDVQQVTQEMQKLNILVAVPELDTNYHAMLFAKAAGIDYTDMQRMSLKDYTTATGVVRDFFLADMEA